VLVEHIRGLGVKCMSFIRWMADVTADMLLGNGEEQITWLGGKMQKHRDIQNNAAKHT